MCYFSDFVMKITVMIATIISSSVAAVFDSGNYYDPEPVRYDAVMVEEISGAIRGNMVMVAEPQPDPGWTGEIPSYYGGDTGCTKEQADIVAWKMRQLGANDETVYWMLKTISRESTCDSSSHNYNPRTGDDSWGLCQLNVLGGHFSSRGILSGWDRYRFASDFNYNVDACVKLWTVCGKGPWNYGDYYCRKPSDFNG
jgi:hypothetical protein